LPGCYAGWVDVAQFPRNEDAHKQQDGKADPYGQCPRHARRFVLSTLTALHHEKESCAQTAQDGNKTHNDKVFHNGDYPVNRRLRFWVISLAALLGVGLSARLGLWQLSRASQKQALQLAMDGGAALTRLTGTDLTVLPDPTQALHRPVTVRGHWIANRTVFLDNRQMNARQGFYVITPLQVEADAGVVLIQRGWVPRNFVDRTAVPTVQTPIGPVEIKGRIALPPAKLYELGHPTTGVIRQNLDMVDFAAELGLPLMPISIQQTDESLDGLQRNWPVASVGVEKHQGYAFQWFGLSALIAVLYVWFQIVRKYFIPTR
jgi:surfeit locus 1 family protein